MGKHKDPYSEESLRAVARRIFKDLSGPPKPSALEPIIVQEFPPDSLSTQECLAAMHRGTEMARQLVKSVEEIKRRAQISLAENPSKHGPN